MRITSKQERDIENLLNSIWAKERHVSTSDMDYIKKMAKKVGRWFYKEDRNMFFTSYPGKLAQKISQFQGLWHSDLSDRSNEERFSLENDGKHLRYWICEDGKRVMSLTIMDLHELRKRTGEEPFIRFYLNGDREIWEYFGDKDIVDHPEKYVDKIVGALISYSFIEKKENENESNSSL